MSLKIAKLSAVVTSHSLRAERIVTSAAGRHDESTFLTVTVEDGEGRRGYGEAATVLVWSGESAQNAKWIVENIFTSQLLGASFDHPGDALELMDRAVVHNSFLKSAIDSALWDLWAVQQNLPAWKLFGDRKPAHEIGIRASIGAYPVGKTVQLAEEFWEEGISTLKFKVGVPGGDDLSRLRAVRDALGDAPKFTVDYNGAFRNAVDAIAHIHSLLPMNLALVEQPTHRDRISLMAEVRRNVDLPILADESIFTREHLAEAIDLDAFDILSIYPGKNGGFTRSLEMVDMAAGAGKECVIGSNLETDIGQAAMAALAAAKCSFPVARLPCDILSSLYYSESSVEAPLKIENGNLLVPDGIGFCVTPKIPSAKHPL